MKQAIFYKNVIFLSVFYENDLDLSKLKVKVIPIFAITNTLWQAYLEYQIIWTATHRPYY